MTYSNMKEQGEGFCLYGSERDFSEKA